MSSVTEPVVVVGVNGSRASVAALRWAAEEADRRHARLHVVLVWSPRAAASYAPAAGRPTAEQQREAAGKKLTALLRRVFRAGLPWRLTPELAQGVAERVLVEESADADLLVLGAAAPPCTSGRSVGPVVRACLSRARCPVVVVSPAEDNDPSETISDPAPTERPHLVAVPGA
jgi:nucleotide-binding universal stress UspA family protein